MDNQARVIELYIKTDGQIPYQNWLERIKDKATRARIINGVTKMEKGNFGISEGVGDGVIELKLDFGPGYRIYYALEEEKIILLLVGGSKKSQKDDIKQSKVYLNDYRSRNDGDEEEN
jgi:putative addiction module killer protein